MLFFRRCLLLWIASFVLEACSVNLTQSSEKFFNKESDSFFKEIPLFYGGDTLFLDNNLLLRYSKSANVSDFPRDKCYGKAFIYANVTQNKSTNPWAIAAIVIPFWPILPVDETLSYQFFAEIFCNNDLIKKIEFKEDERINSFWYGKFRSDLVNSASNEIHRKLIERLKFELTHKRNADLNSASDY